MITFQPISIKARSTVKKIAKDQAQGIADNIVNKVIPPAKLPLPGLPAPMTTESKPAPAWMKWALAGLAALALVKVVRG